MASDRPKCTGQNRAGGPCGADVQPGRPFCIWHDPERADDRRRWQAEGGRARSHTARAQRELEMADAGVKQLPGVLYRALQKCEAGELEPGRASAMATLGRAIVAATQAAELDERLTALERRAGITTTRFPA